MLIPILAQIAGYSIGQLAIFIIVVAAICAVVFVALRQFGVSIPPFVVTLFWILVVAVVCVLCVRFLMSV